MPVTSADSTLSGTYKLMVTVQFYVILSSILVTSAVLQIRWGHSNKPYFFIKNIFCDPLRGSLIWVCTSWFGMFVQILTFFST